MDSPTPIRTKLLRILLVPLISMVVLWGFIAFSNADELVGANRFDDRWLTMSAPARQVIEELQKERKLTAETLGSTSAELIGQRKVTDEKVQLLRQAANTETVTEDAAVFSARMRELVRELDALRQLRLSVDDGRLATPHRMTQAYNILIDEATRRLGNRDVEGEVANVREIRGATSYSDAAEYLAREYALLAAGIRLGKMTATDRAAFIAAFTSRRDAFADALRDAGPDLRPRIEALADSEPYKRILQVEDRMFAWSTMGRPPVDGQRWRDDVEGVVAAMEREARAELAGATEQQEVERARTAVWASLILLLGAGAVALSIFLSYRFGNSIVAEFRRLQEAAAHMAKERLPRVVERLRKGEDVNVEDEAPALPPADTAEFNEVVKSFSAVQRTAVEAAVGQATLRKGIAQVFLNLAWRNQVLLQRQLTLLDAMERRVEEPDILEDLFKLDHLTTRMRRHAENLIILSESAPARRWREPVPIYDLVRSAVLEVEDYTRVTVSPMPNAPMLLGSAVTDVIHLISELVENATVFSPPDTTVTVRSTKAANGFALEIEDRGLGLNPAMLEEFNARLADPPEFDLADSDRLGLFVVARLANRHNIKVMLRPSPYDGTTAIVMLPTTLLVTPDMPDLGPGPQGAEQSRDLRVNRPMRALSTVAESRSIGAFSLPSEPSPPGLSTDTVIPAVSPVTGSPIVSSAEPPGPAPAASGRPYDAPSTPAGGPATGGFPVPPTGSPADGAPDGSAPDGPGTIISGVASRPATTGPGTGAAPGGSSAGPGPGTPSVFGPAAAPGGPAPDSSDPGYSSPWFAPERPEQRPASPVFAAPPTAAPVPPPAPRPATGGPVPEFDDDEDLDGLPRRIPQASLAPQLRKRADRREEVSSRSPEELMDLMASMQRGWQQGRSLVEQGRGQGPGPESGPGRARGGPHGPGAGPHRGPGTDHGDGPIQVTGPPPGQGHGPAERGRGQTEQGHEMWKRKDGKPDVRPQN